jgi:hypothetical protein
VDETVEDRPGALRETPVAVREHSRRILVRGPGIEASGEARELALLAGESADRGLVHRLEPVLDIPKEPVGLLEATALAPAQRADLLQPAQGGQGSGAADAGMLASVQELEELHGELDVSNPAAPLLDLSALAAAPGDALLDALLVLLDRADPGGVQPPVVDDRLELGGQQAPQRPVSGHRAELDQRLTLPRARAGPVVLERRGQRPHERPPRALRPQPHVDAEREPVRGLPRQQPAEALRQLRVRLPPRPGHLPVLGRGVDEDQIDVGRVVELPAAELPHGEDGEAGHRIDQVARGRGQRPLDEVLGHIGDPARHHLERRRPAQIVHEDAAQVTTAVAPQRAQDRVLVGAVDGGQELAPQVLPVRRRPRTDQHGGLLGLGEEDAGQALARAQDGRQRPRPLRNLEHLRGQIGRVGCGREQQVEVPESPVRIGRGRDDGEEVVPRLRKQRGEIAEHASRRDGVVESVALEDSGDPVRRLADRSQRVSHGARQATANGCRARGSLVRGGEGGSPPSCPGSAGLRLATAPAAGLLLPTLLVRRDGVGEVADPLLLERRAEPTEGLVDGLEDVADVLAPARALAEAAHRRNDRSVHGLDDLAEVDLLRPSGQRVAALHPAVAQHEAAPPQGLEHLRQVGGADVEEGRDLVDVDDLALGLAAEVAQSVNCIAGGDTDLHGTRFLPRENRCGGS